MSWALTSKQDNWRLNYLRLTNLDIAQDSYLNPVSGDIEESDRDKSKLISSCRIEIYSKIDSIF